MSVPAWAWFAPAAFVVAMLALDLLVLHRRAHEVSLKEAGFWSAACAAMGFGFGALLWAWEGGDIGPGLPGRRWRAGLCPLGRHSCVPSRRW